LRLAFRPTAENGKRLLAGSGSPQMVDISEGEAELRRTFPTQSSKQRAATAELCDPSGKP
jgi:hypothetical protein